VKRREAVDTFQRQSGLFLRSPSDVLYRETPIPGDVPDYILRKLPDLEIDHYLGCLEAYLHEADGGTWVLPFLATETNQWPRTNDSAIRVWIIRTLDNVGVPRAVTQEKGKFLDLASRLAELLKQSKLPHGTALGRKDFADDPELLPNKGRYQWRGVTVGE